MSNFMSECDVRDGWRHVLAVVQQRHDAGVEGFHAAAVVLLGITFIHSFHDGNETQNSF